MIALDVEHNSRWSPELEAIQRVDWDAFFSLTFQRKPTGYWPAVRTFFKYLRTVGPQLDLDYRSIQFALRYEHGEKTGRPHLHALMRAVPVNTAALFCWKHGWEGDFLKYERANPLAATYKSGRFVADENGIGCGSARVRKYHEVKDEACDYFVKKAASKYEAGKIPLADKIFFSRAFTNRLKGLQHLENTAA